ncbi:pif1 [Symbiodinium sp. CCMP2592]|nr:pif1 [Symbiodinium sp. CCMP2592]
MRLRLTHNVDKDRGFVNGATGKVQSVLRQDVFILKSSQNVPILVHPITLRGRKYLPVSYGWATTIRRAQGATLNKIALWFDRRVADKGYAYVGLSRARKATDVYLIGKVRRTDWRAVGTHNEQLRPSHLSDTTETEDSRSATDFQESEEEPNDSDFEDDEPSTNGFTSDEPDTSGRTDEPSTDAFETTEDDPNSFDFENFRDESSTPSFEPASDN